MATRFISAMCLTLLLSACTMGPDFHVPEWHLPHFWAMDAREKAIGQARAVVPAPGDPDGDWWHAFNDPLLDDMEADIASQNLDVQTAITRLDESRAQRGVAAADLFPALGGSTSFTREKPSNKGAFSLFGGGGGGQQAQGGANAIPTTTKIPAFNIWQYGFDASWELDLWGGVRRGVESADAQVLAADAMRRSALLSAQAELARNYIDLRGAQDSLRIARDDVTAAQAQANLARDQAKSGLTSEEDTTTADAQVALQAARLPQLTQQAQADINAIELLLGHMPGDMSAALAAQAPPPLPATVPVVAPSELLRRRPDIAAAAAQLHAATAEIGVAEADFLPSVTLTGSGAIQGLKFSNLDDWAARTWSFGPSISLPIFQGGRLVQTLELRKAEQREAAISYRKTVLTALHETDDALTGVIAEQARLAQLRRAEDRQRLALNLGQSRYRHGLANFVDVTVAEQNLFSVEQQAADSRTTLGTNLIQLYKAMGGGVAANKEL